VLVFILHRIKNVDLGYVNVQQNLAMQTQMVYEFFLCQKIYATQMIADPNSPSTQKDL
jgi:hypothetical protein